MAGPFDSQSLQNAVQATPQATQQPAAQAQPKESGTGFWPGATVLGSNLADGISTYAAMHNNPYVREGNAALGQNPLGIMGIKGGLGLAELLIGRQLAKSGHPTGAKVFDYLASVPPALAAVHNVGMINNRPK